MSRGYHINYAQFRRQLEFYIAQREEKKTPKPRQLTPSDFECGA